MRYADAGGVRIAYDDYGPRADVAVLCLPGWWLDRGFFAALAERLVARHRVIGLDWRGHGDSSRPPTDFGHEQLADDAEAVIEVSGVRCVVLVSQAHGGWAALELRRRLGDRVERIVASSRLVLDPPPPFVGALEALQDPEQWREAREQLFSMWLSGAPVIVADLLPGATAEPTEGFPGTTLTPPTRLGGTSVGVFLYVEDVDGFVQRAVDAGATLALPVQDRFWGDRFGVIVDPFGHEWGVSRHTEDLTPDEIGQRARKAMTAADSNW